MTQTTSNKLSLGFLLLIIATAIIVAVVSTLVQRLFFGTSNVAITAALVSITLVGFWRRKQRKTP